MTSGESRPHSSKLKQQRLAAWQPILTPPHASACFLLTAVIFIPIGVAILQANDNVVDVEFRYDNVRSCTSANNDRVLNFSWGNRNQTTSMGCVIGVDFDISARMEPPIYMYYKLTRFYQNHRRYSGSRLDTQLAGEVPSSVSDADPMATVGDANGLSGTVFSVGGVNRTYGEFTYSPAGLIAWSMFNDSFVLSQYTDANPVRGSPRMLICNGSAFDRYTNNPLTTGNSCVKKGIAWQSDVADKFKVPQLGPNVWSAPRSGYGAANLSSNSVFFNEGWYAGEAGHRVPVTTDEDFMVWMRTSSLPEFRKLYRIITVPLDPGTYHMEITELFDVSSFDGTKSVVLTTLSWVGGKNPFLATVYLVLGCLAFVAAIVFAGIHHACGDRTQRAIDELMHEGR